MEQGDQIAGSQETDCIKPRSVAEGDDSQDDPVRGRSEKTRATATDSTNTLQVFLEGSLLRAAEVSAWKLDRMAKEKENALAEMDRKLQHKDEELQHAKTLLSSKTEELDLMKEKMLIDAWSEPTKVEGGTNSKGTSKNKSSDQQRQLHQEIKELKATLSSYQATGMDPKESSRCAMT